MCLVQPPRSHRHRSGNTLLSQLADRADSETAKAEVREALLAVRAMLDTLGLDPLAEPWVSAGAAGGAADGTAESPEHAALEALIAGQLTPVPKLARPRISPRPIRFATP